jgi:hypothetical protein
MAKPRTPRLKVFQTQLGFFESVVAAPNQAAALRAWGTHQNLFASKDAKVSTDKAAVAAALEHPGTPLQRAIGTKDPFQIEPATAPGTGASKTASNQSTRTRAARPKADRSELDRAEAALRQLEQRRQQEEAELEQAQKDLQARRSKARQDYLAERKTAASAISKARAAYRATGGRG